MVESDDLARLQIRPRDVRALMPIAVKTSEGEIPKIGPASMLARNDVIDREGQRIDIGGKVTILASVWARRRTSRAISRFTPDDGPAVTL